MRAAQERGAAALEYLGTLLLVAGVVTALITTMSLGFFGQGLQDVTTEAICRVVNLGGGGCGAQAPSGDQIVVSFDNTELDAGFDAFVVEGSVQVGSEVTVYNDGTATVTLYVSADVAAQLDAGGDTADISVGVGGEIAYTYTFDSEEEALAFEAAVHDAAVPDVGVGDVLGAADGALGCALDTLNPFNGVCNPITATADYVYDVAVGDLVDVLNDNADANTGQEYTLEVVGGAGVGLNLDGIPGGELVPTGEFSGEAALGGTYDTVSGDLTLYGRIEIEAAAGVPGANAEGAAEVRLEGVFNNGELIEIRVVGAASGAAEVGDLSAFFSVNGVADAVAGESAGIDIDTDKPGLAATAVASLDMTDPSNQQLAQDFLTGQAGITDLLEASTAVVQTFDTNTNGGSFDAVVVDGSLTNTTGEMTNTYVKPPGQTGLLDVTDSVNEQAAGNG